MEEARPKLGFLVAVTPTMRSWNSVVGFLKDWDAAPDAGCVKPSSLSYLLVEPREGFAASPSTSLRNPGFDEANDLATASLGDEGSVIVGARE